MISATDREAAIALVVAYAGALDARAWDGFEALFDETVDIDYSSLGTSHGVFTAREWANRCRVLGAFAATHHKVTNFDVAADIGNDALSVTSYVDAAHFIETGGRMLEAYVLGVYRHRLTRRRGGWRINGCQMTVSGFPGGRARFDEAFAAARFVFSAGTSPGADQ